MSTKIYSGFYLETTDLADIRDMVAPFCKELREKVRTDHVARFAARLAKRLDCAAVGLGRDAPRTSMSPYRRVLKSTQEEIRAACTLGLFPRDDRTYGIVLADRCDGESRWLIRRNVREFAYWDDQDRPDYVSAEGWESRRALWAELVGRDAAVDRGLVVDCLGRVDGFVCAVEAVAAMPTREARARDVAEAALHHDALASRTDKAAYTAWHARHLQWLATPYGAAARAAKTAEVIARIPESYTLGDINE